MVGAMKWNSKTRPGVCLSAVLRRAGLFEQVVTDPPGISPFIRKELCTRHVEDLPPVVPHGSVLLSIRLG